jgi:hypothetical protein
MDNRNAEFYILNYTDKEIYVILNNDDEIKIIQPTKLKYGFNGVDIEQYYNDNSVYEWHSDLKWYINLGENSYFHKNISEYDLIVSSKDYYSQKIKILNNKNECLLSEELDFTDLNKTYEIKDSPLGGLWKFEDNISSGNVFFKDLFGNKMLILYDNIGPHRFSNPKYILIIPPSEIEFN